MIIEFVVVARAAVCVYAYLANRFRSSIRLLAQEIVYWCGVSLCYYNRSQTVV